MIVTVEPRAAVAITRGHPWIFREALRLPRSAAPRTGDVVRVVSSNGDDLGWGLYDAQSPIAVRIWAHHRDAPNAARDIEPRAAERLMGSAVERAIRARDGLFSPEQTSAYRLCNGEGDRVPGLVVDRYGDAAVMRTDGDAMASWRDRLVSLLAKALEPRGVRTLLARTLLAHPQDGDLKSVRVWGAACDDVVEVRENGVIMEVDLARGQKTGAFLDQRDNRARVRQLARGAERVLNLFSYAGGFSIAAALGSPRAHVTSVDSASRGHANAQRAFRKNGLDPSAHAFVTADAFVYLEQARKRSERFDLIVCDPPSFAPNERAKRNALSSYAKLHRACAALLAPGGILCASSCSSHVTLEEFLGTLDDATLQRHDLCVREALGPPADHPTLASFPEGRYLKFIVLS